MTPKEVVYKWVEAFNTRDAEAGSRLYHEDAVILQVAFGVPLLGREAIYKNLKEFFTRVPDNETKILKLYEDDEWAILEWNGSGTFYQTSGSLGHWFKLQGCGFFRVVEGKIKEQRGYFDKATWFKQVGLPVD